MGLDVVELVLRCEEVFDIELEDNRLEHTRTVGDLFELICAQLGLPTSQTSPATLTGPTSPHRSSKPWARETAWATLVGICTDQLQVDEDKITYTARFVEDLRVD